MSEADVIITANPFDDPSIHSSQQDHEDISTLEVGRNASLTLGTDSLIVLGMIGLCWDLTLPELLLNGFQTKDLQQKGRRNATAVFLEVKP